MKGEMGFGKDKLRSRYIGPFEIFERVEAIAYRSVLPPQLSTIHDIFKVYVVKVRPRFVTRIGVRTTWSPKMIMMQQSFGT